MNADEKLFRELDAPAARDGFERARQLAFERGLESTIEQRLDWLEEVLEVARASGALAAEIERRHRLSGQWRLVEPSR